MHRAHNNVLPETLQDVFFRNRRGSFPIRYSTNEAMKRNISHAGPKIWHNLADNCKEVSSKNVFKTRAKAYLLNN